jgi:phosphatidylglycerol---prolipoprotein diacylglyceryl transferase
MLTYPLIDPVAFTVGPLAIRWYALAYLAGFLLGWWFVMRLAKKAGSTITPKHYDDFLTYAILGTILGGRLGYVLFYQTAFYAANPLAVLEIWQGGMSFHGGLLGVIAAAWFYTRQQKISFLAFADGLAVVAPIGLFFGRIANFINGELVGRITTSPLGIVFPHMGPEPRHASQLYEAFFEGLVLFVILVLCSRYPSVIRREGFRAGLFLFLYGLFRFGIEFFREPDAQLGFLFAGATMGQMLCVPMMAIGLYLYFRSARSLR